MENEARQKILLKVAKEFNELLQPEPPIKTMETTSVRYLEAKIKKASELLEDGDTITKGTKTILHVLECDVPAGVKIKGEKNVPTKQKVTAKRAAANIDKAVAKGVSKNVKKKTTNKKVVTKKLTGRTKAPGRLAYMEKLISSGKYSQKEIIAMTEKKFPVVTKATIAVDISHAKNKAYSIFDKLVIASTVSIKGKDKKVLIFK